MALRQRNVADTEIGRASCQLSDVDDDFDDEDSCVTTQTVDSSDERNIYGNPQD